MPKKTTIENDLKKLKEIIEQFEKGEIEIEKGIEEYKKASALIKKIEKSLAGAEEEINEISESI